ncbi:MAG: Tfp pilus assembly protein FimT/FimU [Terriglobia bacterium]
MKRYANSGFTLLEAVVVMGITVLVGAMAIPVFSNAMKSYYQSATVSAVAGAIQTTRFQAIMHGYPYEVVFTPSTLSYQLFSEVPPATTYSLVVPQAGSSTTPLPSAGRVTMTVFTCSVALTNWACTPSPDLVASTATTITYTFSANGTVTTNPVAVGLQISNSVKSNTVWVSGVGDVGTSSP